MIELIIREAYKDKKALVEKEDKTETDPQVIKDLRECGYGVDKPEEPKPTAADRSQI